jgi:hypothetical protein
MEFKFYIIYMCVCVRACVRACVCVCFVFALEGLNIKTFVDKVPVLSL